MSKPRNRTEAVAQGFTVDSHCYPWCAYKGSRFQPDEWHSILTDKEAHAGQLAEALRQIATVEANEKGEPETQSYEIATAALAAWEKEAQ